MIALRLAEGTRTVIKMVFGIIKRVMASSCSRLDGERYIVIACRKKESVVIESIFSYKLGWSRDFCVHTQINSAVHPTNYVEFFFVGGYVCTPGCSLVQVFFVVRF